MVTKFQIDVIHFMEYVKDLSIPQEPTLLEDVQERELCKALVMEEAQELCQAISDQDLVAIADGVVDLIYVAYYTANKHGIEVEPIWNEIQRSNMSKKGGKKAPNGKQLKPPWYSPPKLKDKFVRMPQPVLYDGFGYPIAWIDAQGREWQVSTPLPVKE